MDALVYLVGRWKPLEVRLAGVDRPAARSEFHWRIIDMGKSRPPTPTPTDEAGAGTSTDTQLEGGIRTADGEVVMDRATLRSRIAARRDDEVDRPEDAPIVPAAEGTREYEEQRLATSGADPDVVPVPHIPTLTAMDPRQVRQMQQAAVMAEADRSTIDEADQPGGRYIVNGREVDAFGLPVKAGGRTNEGQ